MPLPSTSRSGRTPHCSTANSVPVRPKPVATSSQMRRTSWRRQASARPATNSGVAQGHARGALHERLDHDRGQPVGVRGEDRLGGGEVAVGRAHDREAQRVEHVGAEAAVADGQRADRVAVVGAGEGEVAVAARRRPGSSRAGTRSSAPAPPRPRRRSRTGRGARRPGPARPSASASSITTWLPLPSSVEWATLSSCAAHRLVELGHPVAQRGDPERRDGVEVAAALDVDELAALGGGDHDRRVVGVGRHLREPVPDHARIPRHPGAVVVGHARRW